MTCLLPIAVVLLVCATPCAGQTDADPVRILFSDKLFYNVADEDGLRAAEAILTSLAGWVAPWAGTYQTVEELRRRAARGEVDVAVMHPLEYIALEGQTSLVPAATASREGYPGHGMMLMVASDSEFQTTRSLEGKRIVLEAISEATVPDFWLQSLLEEGVEAGLTEIRVDRKIVSGAMQAALSVYFGNAEACIVGKQNYSDIVKENPYVGRELRAIREIEDVCRTVICIREGFPEADKVMEMMLSLNASVQGRILLGFFSVDRLLPIGPDHLIQVRKLARFGDGVARRIASERNGL